MGMEATENIVRLAPDMVPSGAALKAGTKLTFTVTGEPDEQGAVPGYFEAAEAEEPEENWEDGLRKSAEMPEPEETS